MRITEAEEESSKGGMRVDVMAKKLTAFGFFLLLLGTAVPALACEEPFMVDGPGSVYEPPPLPTCEARRQLWTALASRSQWDLVQNWQGPVAFAVTDLDGNGQLEILAVAQEEGLIHGCEVQAGNGNWEKVPGKELERLLKGCWQSPAWFTIPLENRKTWLESPPSHNIRMLLDSYEIFARRKQGFG